MYAIHALLYISEENYLLIPRDSANRHTFFTLDHLEKQNERQKKITGVYKSSIND
ncbi:hypothetical protein RchiOBHm_Chr2g0136871 [Rosa chinensis]|uniref:Uncharacterized protein n=1 Tax=Rosa chinensis TaxID=74649 RepID=A0A2P6RWG3_ROSCH|nr:hypothetical protein RchiOBHm_Chr2g0136871 [Rosa chinensis]